MGDYEDRDLSMSGYKAGVVRPEFERMLSDARAGRLDVIVVHLPLRRLAAAWCADGHSAPPLVVQAGGLRRHASLIQRILQDPYVIGHAVEPVSERMETYERMETKDGAIREQIFVSRY